MENNVSDLVVLQILSSRSCQEMTDMLKSINTSYYDSRNITPEDFIKVFRIPHCIPKTYMGLQGVGKWIITIILISFLLFGLIGNILSALIMYRRARRGITSYYYLAILAIVDIGVLYSGCLLFLLELTFNYHPMLENKMYCRLGLYISHLFTYMSAWLIVAVTFERFIVVRFPFQSILVCRMHVAYAITLFLLVFFSIYTTHFFFTADKIEVGIQTEDGYHPNYSVCDICNSRRLFSFLDLYFYSLLPSLMILILNLLIIFTMFHAIKQRRTYLQASDYVSTRETCMRNHHQKNKSSSSIRTQFFRSRSLESTLAGRSSNNRHRSNRHCSSKMSLQQKSQQVLLDPTSAAGIRLTCLLLAISFIFVLCTVPLCFRGFMADSLPKDGSTTKWRMIGICFRLLMYLNHTINFLLYCFTGRAFRSECRKILCGLWALRTIHISCTTDSESHKHHHFQQQQQQQQQQQLMFQDRNRMMIACQQHRWKKSYL